MFFVFGWGRQTKNDFGPTLPGRCPNCKNNGFHRLLHIRKWFTLFFIPVFPYESHHYLLCDVCSRGLELHGPQIEKAKQLNEATASYLKKLTTKEQYQVVLNNLSLLQ